MTIIAKFTSFVNNAYVITLCYTALMEKSHKLSEEIRAEEQKALQEIISRRDAALQRFRLLFTLTGSFGLVATFYGFEHMIDSIPVLADNPMILLATGVIILFATGKLYQKL
jgi:hypothetical protein